MDANTAALNLIQVGPDDKIKDMSAFYDALVEDAHLEGEEESRAEDIIETEPTLSSGSQT